MVQKAILLGVAFFLGSKNLCSSGFGVVTLKGAPFFNYSLFLHENGLEYVKMVNKQSPIVQFYILLQ